MTSETKDKIIDFLYAATAWTVMGAFAGLVIISFWREILKGLQL